MKRLMLTIALTVALSSVVFGQPLWTKKAAKSVFTLKTFAADGSLLGESCGFFVGEGGEAVSNFAPFRGASKGVVVDAQGKEYTVECILGANDMYDIAKFRISAKRTVPLTLASSSLGTTVWLLPYKGKPIEGVVRKTEKVQGDYDYFTLAVKAPQAATSCPLLNEDGDVIGLLQRPMSDNDTVNYAVGVRFATELAIGGLSINDPALKQTRIKKDLPDQLEQALLTMYVAPSVLDSADYVTLVGDFIKKFPTAQDGYVARAQMEVDAGKFSDADADMAQAIKVADKKDDAHFNYSKLIYRKELEKADFPYAAWSLDKAISEADAAYSINPLPVYRELKAQILFTQKKYEESCAIYQELTTTNLRNAQLFFNAARCKEQLRDTTAMLALLDSAVSTFNKPYLKEAAPYILARAQTLLAVGRYRDAVLDFNEYERLVPTGLNDNFYFIREQAELEGHLYQQALNDIKKAIQLAPANYAYYAEKAMIEVRVNLLDDAVQSASECIKVAPDQSDGYLFLGLAQCLKENKAEGTKNLQKALELGNPQAQGLIDKYSK